VFVDIVFVPPSVLTPYRAPFEVRFATVLFVIEFSANLEWLLAAQICEK
jgi:hypothetical protein